MLEKKILRSITNVLDCEKLYNYIIIYENKPLKPDILLAPIALNIISVQPNQKKEESVTKRHRNKIMCQIQKEPVRNFIGRPHSYRG